MDRNYYFNLCVARSYKTFSLIARRPVTVSFQSESLDKKVREVYYLAPSNKLGSNLSNLVLQNIDC